MYISSDLRAGFGRTPIQTGAINFAEFFVRDEVAPIFVKLEFADRPSLVVGERAPRLTGGVNFRDIGGYATADGRWTNWGQIYRSGHLSNLTEKDKKKIERRGVRKICDFRTREESQTESTDLLKNAELRVIGIPPGVGDKRYFHRLFADAAREKIIYTRSNNWMDICQKIFDKR